MNGRTEGAVSGPLEPPSRNQQLPARCPSPTSATPAMRSSSTTLSRTPPAPFHEHHRSESLPEEGGRRLSQPHPTSAPRLQRETSLAVRTPLVSPVPSLPSNSSHHSFRRSSLVPAVLLPPSYHTAAHSLPASQSGRTPPSAASVRSSAEAPSLHALQPRVSEGPGVSWCPLLTVYPSATSARRRDPDAVGGRTVSGTRCEEERQQPGPTLPTTYANGSDGCADSSSQWTPSHSRSPSSMTRSSTGAELGFARRPVDRHLPHIEEPEATHPTPCHSPAERSPMKQQDLLEFGLTQQYVDVKGSEAPSVSPFGFPHGTEETAPWNGTRHERHASLSQVPHCSSRGNEPPAPHAGEHSLRVDVKDAAASESEVSSVLPAAPQLQGQRGTEDGSSATPTPPRQKRGTVWLEQEEPPPRPSFEWERRHDRTDAPLFTLETGAVGPVGRNTTPTQRSPSTEWNTSARTQGKGLQRRTPDAGSSRNPPVPPPLQSGSRTQSDDTYGRDSETIPAGALLDSKDLSPNAGGEISSIRSHRRRHRSGQLRRSNSCTASLSFTLLGTTRTPSSTVMVPSSAANPPLQRGSLRTEQNTLLFTQCVPLTPQPSLPGHLTRHGSAGAVLHKLRLETTSVSSSIVQRHDAPMLLTARQRQPHESSSSPVNRGIPSENPPGSLPHHQRHAWHETSPSTPQDDSKTRNININAITSPTRNTDSEERISVLPTCIPLLAAASHPSDGFHLFSVPHPPPPHETSPPSSPPASPKCPAASSTPQRRSDSKHRVDCKRSAVTCRAARRVVSQNPYVASDMPFLESSTNPFPMPQQNPPPVHSVSHPVLSLPSSLIAEEAAEGGRAETPLVLFSNTQQEATRHPSLKRAASPLSPADEPVSPFQQSVQLLDLFPVSSSANLLESRRMTTGRGSVNSCSSSRKSAFQGLPKRFSGVERNTNPYPAMIPGGNISLSDAPLSRKTSDVQEDPLSLLPLSEPFASSITNRSLSPPYTSSSSPRALPQRSAHPCRPSLVVSPCGAQRSYSTLRSVTAASAFPAAAVKATVSGRLLSFSPSMTLFAPSSITSCPMTQSSNLSASPSAVAPLLQNALGYQWELACFAPPMPNSSAVEEATLQDESCQLTQLPTLLPRGASASAMPRSLFHSEASSSTSLYQQRKDEKKSASIDHPLARERRHTLTATPTLLAGVLHGDEQGGSDTTYRRPTSQLYRNGVAQVAVSGTDSISLTSRLSSQRSASRDVISADGSGAASRQSSASLLLSPHASSAGSCRNTTTHFNTGATEELNYNNNNK